MDKKEMKERNNGGAGKRRERIASGSPD